MPLTSFRPSFPSTGPAQIMHNDGKLIIATWERHLLSVWRSEIESAGVATWARCATDYGKQLGGKKLNIVGYIEPESMFEGSEMTFQATVDALKRIESFVAAMVMVYPREGFWSAAMRGRVTAMFTESSCGVTYSVQPNLPDAIAWLGTHGASDMTAPLAGLSAQFDALRAL